MGHVGELIAPSFHKNHIICLAKVKIFILLAMIAIPGDSKKKQQNENTWVPHHDHEAIATMTCTAKQVTYLS